MTDVATQTLWVQRPNRRTTSTQTDYREEDSRPLPVGRVFHTHPEDSPWKRMFLSLLTEYDCKNTMAAVREEWTLEKNQGRSQELNACFTYHVYLITKDWSQKAALWRRGARMTRDLIILRTWSSTGNNSWTSIKDRLHEFIESLDMETADVLISQLCKTYDGFFPTKVEERRTTMNMKYKRPKKGTRGR